MTERRLHLILILQGLICVSALLALLYVLVRPDHSTINALDAARRETTRLADRFEELDRALLEHDARIRALDSDPEGTPADYQALVQEVTRGAQYFEELAFHVELLLEALSGSSFASTDRRNTPPPDSTDV